MSKVHRSMAREVHKPSKPAVKRVAAAGGARKAGAASRKVAKPESEPIAVVAQGGIAISVKAKARPGTAAVLAIGDEVLRGEIANSNAAYLSDRLFDAGYDA